MGASRTHPWLLTVASAAAGADRRVERIRDAGLRFTQGVLGASLSAADMTALTVRLYETGSRSYDPQAGLMGWEEAWFQAALPAPPSAILVGGAGAGREVMALRALGHRVDAFEPAPGLAERCRRLEGDGRVDVGDYDMFAAAVLDGEQNALAPFAALRYDAVILGWSSLSHVFLRSDQARTLQAATRLTPLGPVLASFLMGTEPAARVQSRAERLGAGLGSRLAGGPPPDRNGASLRFFWHSGFVYLFSEPELVGHAESLGREMRLQREPYPHASFALASGSSPDRDA